MQVPHAYIEIHAIHDTEVELSVSPSHRGWRARVRPGRSALNGFDGVYPTRDDAEATARLAFQLLFPSHACGSYCRRFEPRGQNRSRAQGGD